MKGRYLIMKTAFKIMSLLLSVSVLLSACLFGCSSPDNSDDHGGTASRPIFTGGNIVNGGLAAEDEKNVYYIHCNDGIDSDGLIASFWYLARSPIGSNEQNVICPASGGINIADGVVYFYVNPFDATSKMTAGIYRMNVDKLEPERIYSLDTSSGFQTIQQLVYNSGKLYFTISVTVRLAGADSALSDSVCVMDDDGQNLKTIATGVYYFDNLNVLSDGNVWYTADPDYSNNATLYHYDGSASTPVATHGRELSNVIIYDDYIYYCSSSDGTYAIRRQPVSGGDSTVIATSSNSISFNIFASRVWYSISSESNMLSSCRIDGSNNVDHMKFGAPYGMGVSNLCFAGGNIYYVPQGFQLETVEHCAIPTPSDTSAPDASGTQKPTETTAATTAATTTTAATAAPTASASPGEPQQIFDFTHAFASSVLGNQSGKNYSATNLIDGKTSTTWCENESGVGVGEWVSLESESEVTVRGLKIANGYWASSELYAKNGKARSVTIEFSDGTSVNCDLPAHSAPGTWDIINFSSGVRTSYIRITVNSADKGNKYSDTCISEIQVLG